MAENEDELRKINNGTLWSSKAEEQEKKKNIIT